ncbi:hypothetical protein OE88DRAFT_1661981 [Heliocybe sulcata]|uniref:Uncharacterized protein n=1 Tax=Heliocybe sulcata TaxID=5364 RepID=A0A5C3MWF4_9AGAM|nr:hypothetical protein OE88DRAFT_1661981 [Heliocybe sulcata]
MSVTKPKALTFTVLSSTPCYSKGLGQKRSQKSSLSRSRPHCLESKLLGNWGPSFTKEHLNRGRVSSSIRKHVGRPSSALSDTPADAYDRCCSDSPRLFRKRPGLRALRAHDIAAGNSTFARLAICSSISTGYTSSGAY